MKKAIEIERSEVANAKSDLNHYPAPIEILKNLNDHVLKSLIDFVEGIVLFEKNCILNSYKLKCTSIAHAIIAAASLRKFLPPLQTTLAVSLHGKYGSARLINICYPLHGERFGARAIFSWGGSYPAAKTAKFNKFILFSLADTRRRTIRML